MHYKAGIIPVAVRIISTWLLRLFFLGFFYFFAFKRLALGHRVLCQGLAVSTGSNLTGKCVIIAIVEGRRRRSEQKKERRGEKGERQRKKEGRDGSRDKMVELTVRGIKKGG